MALPSPPAEPGGTHTPRVGVLGSPGVQEQQSAGEGLGQDPGGHSGDRQETFPACGGEHGAGKEDPDSPWRDEGRVSSAPEHPNPWLRQDAG